jgi:hypothetical protein
VLAWLLLGSLLGSCLALAWPLLGSCLALERESATVP